MFKAWMNTSNVGKITSRPFSWWGVEAIAGGEEGAWDTGCEEDPESPALSICQPAAPSAKSQLLWWTTLWSHEPYAYNQDADFLIRYSPVSSSTPDEFKYPCPPMVDRTTRPNLFYSWGEA